MNRRTLLTLISTALLPACGRDGGVTAAPVFLTLLC